MQYFAVLLRMGGERSEPPASRYQRQKVNNFFLNKIKFDFNIFSLFRKKHFKTTHPVGEASDQHIYYNITIFFHSKKLRLILQVEFRMPTLYSFFCCYSLFLSLTFKIVCHKYKIVVKN